nr:putative membrane lipoprotein precursor [Mycoplasma arthritidis] [Metamycoplasma arthritidis]
MKKSLLLIPILSALTTLPLLIAAKCKPEETQEQKDEKLAKKYEKEYIDKQKYVFDDFEQFKMKLEHFLLEKDENIRNSWKESWIDYPNRNIKK